MTQLLINLLVFLVSVLLLITVHEFGHFCVARCLGVKVVRFSVGFGRPLWRWIGRSGTEYVIALLPLGGYVRLLDERDGGEVPEKDQPLAFNRQSILKRALIILAGPGINVLFAVFAFWIMWMIGVERMRPVVGEVIPESIAAQSGFPVGAEIMAVNGQPTTNWPKVTIALVGWLGETGDLPIQARLKNEPPRTYIMHLNNWRTNSLQPDPLTSLGLKPFQPEIPLTIGKVRADSPAALAGLRVGDKILTINGEKLTDWVDLVKQIQSHPNELVQLTVERGHEPIHLDIKVGRQLSRFQWIGYMGIEPIAVDWPVGMVYQLKYSPGSAFLASLKEVQVLTKFNFVVLAKLIRGQVSMKSLGGPISIYQSTSFAFHQGLIIFIGFLGLLSLMLAIVNILPIPGLDGGHILFFIIEAIMRRPLSPAVQMLIVRLGFIFLLVIMMQATINDIFRSVS